MVILEIFPYQFSTITDQSVRPLVVCNLWLSPVMNIP